MRIDAVTYHPLKQKFTDVLTVDILKEYFKVMEDYVNQNDPNDRTDIMFKMIKYSLAHTKNIEIIDETIEILHKNENISEFYRFLMLNKYFRTHAINVIKHKDLELGTTNLAHTLEYGKTEDIQVNGSIVISNLLKRGCKTERVSDAISSLLHTYPLTDDDVFNLLNKYKGTAWSLYVKVTPEVFGRILKKQKNIEIGFLVNKRDIFTEENVKLMSKHIDNIKPYDLNKLREHGIFTESGFRDIIGDKYYLLKNFNYYYVYSKYELETIVYNHPKHMPSIIDCVKRDMLDENIVNAILDYVKVSGNVSLSGDFITLIAAWPGVTEEIMDKLVSIYKIQNIHLFSSCVDNRKYTINQNSFNLLNNRKAILIDKNLRLLFHLAPLMDLNTKDMTTVIDSFLSNKKTKEYHFNAGGLGVILNKKEVIDESVIDYMFNLKYSDFCEAITTMSNRMIWPHYREYNQCKKNSKKKEKFTKDIIEYFRTVS